MTENEKIKTIYLGDKNGCFAKDKVCIEISPALLEELTNIFKARAEHSTNYVNQGFERKKADFFDEAYEAWKTARNELDDKNMQQVKERN